MGVDERTARDEREVIALAARGLVAPARLLLLDVEAFSGAPRLLAWVCACRALRVSGRGATFQGARYTLVTMPRLDVSEGAWAGLLGEAEEELDAAEDVEAPSVDAVARLLAHQRARRARAWIAPVLEALDVGEVSVEAAKRLRDAADMCEGRL